MSVRFAAGSHLVPLIRNPVQLRRIAMHAANDNALAEIESDLMRAALVHFSRLGLAAATDARDRARQAHFRGDRDGCRYWLEVCRALDRRMGAALATNLTQRARR